MITARSILLLLLAVASTSAALVSEVKPSERKDNATLPEAQTTTSATAKSSAAPDDGGNDPTNLQKRNIEQTVGYGYRYNTVLRSTNQRRQPSYPQRVMSPSPADPSPSSAPYFFQQQIQPTPPPPPKPVHRFGSAQLPSYPRHYNRQEPTEARPVTESPVPLQHNADVNLYKEFFTFDDAMPSYQLAPRSEGTSFLAPQALLLAPAGAHHLGGHAQQVIPVLILRLDSAAHFPYPMMAMQVVPREDVARIYAPAGQADPSQASPQYVDLAYAGINPNLAAYFPAETQQQYTDEKRRLQSATVMQQERYRSQTESPVGKVGLRRPPGTVSAGSPSAAMQGRTEVTIHHSPGMTAQDYKESVEEQEES